MEKEESNLSEKILNEFHRNKFSVRNGYTELLDSKDVKEFIKLLREDCVICPEFRDWEKDLPLHYFKLTTELERFIRWFKIEKLDKLAGEKLT